MTASPILLDARVSAALLGVSLRRFRDLCKETGFPQSRSLGPRSTRWLRSELEQYAANLPMGCCKEEPEQLAAARRARLERLSDSGVSISTIGHLDHRPNACRIRTHDSLVRSARSQTGVNEINDLRRPHLPRMSMSAYRRCQESRKGHASERDECSVCQ
jgi:predicted DNA-binding transcriptional regulator AlpA